MKNTQKIALLVGSIGALSLTACGGYQISMNTTYKELASEIAKNNFTYKSEVVSEGQKDIVQFKREGRKLYNHTKSNNKETKTYVFELENDVYYKAEQVDGGEWKVQKMNGLLANVELAIYDVIGQSFMANFDPTAETLEINQAVLFAYGQSETRFFGDTVTVILKDESETATTSMTSIGSTKVNIPSAVKKLCK